ADDFEFIERTNTGANTIDLTSVAFTIGITFSFPTGNTLAPGERIIVTSNRGAFEARYGAGTATIAGTYTGNLRNSGEQVRLEAADTTPIADFTYGDDSPWPTSADGPGYSLVFSGSTPTDPLDWRSSTMLGGNPGSSDTQSFDGTTSDLIPYALAGQQQVEIDGDDFVLSFLQNLAADDAEILVEYSNDLISWTTASADDLVSRVNQGDGTARLSFQSPISADASGRQFARVRVQLRE
ncbi:MAG: lamin tail domain-containing protein, partial [Verrucomicrobiales bacterium]